MKALIVDDEKHVREAVKMIVEWKRFGFTAIFEAEDGEEAIAIAREERPELIVTHMRMPRADRLTSAGMDLQKLPGKQDDRRQRSRRFRICAQYGEVRRDRLHFETDRCRSAE